MRERAPLSRAGFDVVLDHLECGAHIAQTFGGEQRAELIFAFKGGGKRDERGEGDLPRLLEPLERSKTNAR